MRTSSASASGLWSLSWEKLREEEFRERENVKDDEKEMERVTS